MLLSPNELAIARSVIYASLFEYPLTANQLHQTLIESRQSLSEIHETVASSLPMQAMVEYRDGFFFPVGCVHWIGERRTREARSHAFLARHRRLLAWICAMPYTRLVSLSGSIAHLNLEAGGDLDLFIVTTRGRVWSVTVAVILLTKLLLQRHTVCANFVVADSHLQLGPPELFTANQIIHLKPPIGEPVLQELLAANPFVARFYPNFDACHSGLSMRPRPIISHVKTALERRCGAVSSPGRVLPPALRIVLARRSAGWRSREQVRLESDCLKLHSHSHRHSILERFDRAMCDALQQADAAWTGRVSASTSTAEITGSSKRLRPCWLRRCRG